MCICWPCFNCWEYPYRKGIVSLVSKVHLKCSVSYRNENTRYRPSLMYTIVCALGYLSILYMSMYRLVLLWGLLMGAPSKNWCVLILNLQNGQSGYARPFYTSCFSWPLWDSCGGLDALCILMKYLLPMVVIAKGFWQQFRVHEINFLVFLLHFCW